MDGKGALVIGPIPVSNNYGRNEGYNGGMKPSPAKPNTNTTLNYGGPQFNDKRVYTPRGPNEPERTKSILEDCRTWSKTFRSSLKNELKSWQDRNPGATHSAWPSYVYK